VSVIAAGGVRRRILVGGVAVALAAVGLGLLRDRAVAMVRVAGQLLARAGDPMWIAPGVGLRVISREDASRLHWGAADAFLDPAWAEVAGGLALGNLRIVHGADPRPVDVVALRIDPARWRPTIYGRADWSRADVASLAAEAGAPIAVNASYFSEDGPIGLVVSGGVRRNRQASRRAAHFLVDATGRPSIVNARRAALDGVVDGFQGFPSVMTSRRTFAYMRVGGRGFDIWKVERRTAACIDGRGMLLLLVTDSLTSGLSLDELATVTGGLGCVDAMGFDGGSSTGLHVAVGETVREVPNLEPVPVILGLVPRDG
jgi:hypothetical protein